jgi:hypothetical protein
MVWKDLILLDVLKGMFTLFLCLSSMIWGRVEAQAISRPPLTVETPVQFLISIHGIFIYLFIYLAGSTMLPHLPAPIKLFDDLHGVLVDKMSRDRGFPKYFAFPLLASCHHCVVPTDGVF